MTGSDEPISIFLVEDNEADVYLTRAALARHFPRCAFTVAHDGAEALGYLERLKQSAGGKAPDLVLVDLNLPLHNGPDILRFMRASPWYAGTVTILLSTSPRDIVGSAAADADHYMEKPATLDEVEAMGRAIADHFRAARGRNARGSGSP